MNVSPMGVRAPTHASPRIPTPPGCEKVAYPAPTRAYRCGGVPTKISIRVGFTKRHPKPSHDVTESDIDRSGGKHMLKLFNGRGRVAAVALQGTG